MKQNLILAGLVLILAAAIAGGYFYPKFVSVGSPAGTSFNSAKVAAINLSPQGITSTSTSLYNGDVSDRIVLDAYVTCSGVTTSYGSLPQATGVDAWHWWAATSTTAAPAPSIANVLLNAMNITVATSTAEAYTATSTYTSPFARRWNAGTYMVFQTNATSSAAVCQPGLHYVAL